MNHSINIVAKRSGLTPYVIRIWEKRYGAVKPSRTRTNRRLYSNEDVERLILLKNATHSGHKIGNIAALPDESLKALVEQDKQFKEKTRPPAEPRRRQSPADELLSYCLDAIKSLDHPRFVENLNRAAVQLGQRGLIVRVIAPLAQTVGELWREGEITAAHEHFASAIIKVFMTNISKPFSIPDSAPSLVVATPHGQVHELGAVIAAAAASGQGWKVIYLGTNLPAAEIAGAVAQNRASAVAMSIVYPEDDPDLPEELSRLRQFLPGETAIVAGGRAAEAYREALDSINAVTCEDVSEFCKMLDRLRRRRPVKNSESSP